MEQKDKTKKPVDPALIYPTPKTYDEIQSTRAKIRAKVIARQPKHVGLMAAVSLTIIFVYTLWMAATIPGMIRYNPIFGVFAGFLLGFVWLGVVYWVVRDILKMFQAKGFGSTPFFVVYAAWVTVFLVLGGVVYGSALALVCLVTAHFLIVSLTIVVAYTEKFSNAQKIAMLAGLWAAAFTGALALYLQNYL